MTLGSTHYTENEDTKSALSHKKFSLSDSMKNLGLISVLMCLWSFYCLSSAAKDINLYCGTCRAIVSELEHSVSKIDPNKKIEVGSYRVDPKGKTRTVQKSYARSETHLTELLENVCGDISENYVETKDAETGKPTLKRIVTHDGKMSSDVDFSQLMADSKTQSADTPPDSKTKKVQFACESIVEDFEDDILHYFKKETPDAAIKICSEIAEFCDNASSKEEL